MRAQKIKIHTRQVKMANRTLKEATGNTSGCTPPSVSWETERGLSTLAAVLLRAAEIILIVGV